MSEQATTVTQEATSSEDVQAPENNSAEQTMYPEKENYENSGNSEKDDNSGSKETESNEPSKDGESDKSEKKDDDKADEPIEYDLKLPKDSALDEGVVDEIAEFAKEQGLSNDQAQNILEREDKAVKEYANAQVEGLKEKSTQWVEEAKNDKELGGENFKENVEHAHRALEKFGSKQLKDTLESTGLGNHPELVRVFSRIGKAMADDTIVRPGSEGSKQKSAEEIMYGGKDD